MSASGPGRAGEGQGGNSEGGMSRCNCSSILKRCSVPASCAGKGVPRTADARLLPPFLTSLTAGFSRSCPGAPPRCTCPPSDLPGWLPGHSCLFGPPPEPLGPPRSISCSQISRPASAWPQPQPIRRPSHPRPGPAPRRLFVLVPHRPDSSLCALACLTPRCWQRRSAHSMCSHLTALLAHLSFD